jgi:hypothetical protein
MVALWLVTSPIVPPARTRPGAWLPDHAARHGRQAGTNYCQ